MADHVDFEVIGVLGGALVVRYRFGSKTIETNVSWDGTGDALVAVKSFAAAALVQMKTPPPPTFAQLAAYVGKVGSTEVQPPPPLPPPVVPPPPVIADPNNPPPMPPMNPPPAG